MIRAIFWDNDGVLVDTERLYFEATRDVLARVGVPLTREQYLDLFLRQNRGAWHLAEAIGMPAAEVEALREERNSLYGRRLLDGPLLIDGVKDVIEALHGRYTMGIVTSSRRDHFDIIHQRTGLLPYFDFVITADDLRCTKPNPEPYLKALERSAVPRESCLAIEDSERGLTAATAAHIECVIVPTNLTRGCAFAGARHVVHELGDVLKLL